ncbi:MAG: mycofactocin biosynthesis chaperone MftB [Streptosporangiales bacterium]|nr:mycofactocin biosynthesis chaperone MftB [Streptosporangiales bacterium]
MSFDAERPYRLNPKVALRPEPFGALAYHFGNRRLTFLKTARMVEVVRALEHHPSARAALRSLAVPEREWPQYERALAALAESEVIDGRE